MTVASSTITSRSVPVNLIKVDVDDSDGTAEVLAAVAGKRHYVWGILATIPANNSLTLKSAATAITPPLASTGLLIVPPVPNPAGAFPICQTAINEALNVALASSGQLGMTVWVETA